MVRYIVLSPVASSRPQQASKVKKTAGMLGERGAEEIPAELHRELLCHLCNESLDREPLRAVLAARMENAEGVKKEMREAAAGDKGKIKVSPLSSFSPYWFLPASSFWLAHL